MEFVLGAAVFMIGVLVGASIAKVNQDKRSDTHYLVGGAGGGGTSYGGEAGKGGAGGGSGRI